MSVSIPTEIAVEVVGYLAAAATGATFYCRRMLSLRAAAIVANLMFISYGALLTLMPVLLLHCFLLPLNIWRFREMLLDRARAREHVAIRPSRPRSRFHRSMAQELERQRDILWLGSDRRHRS
jgi:energy-converting hydrogenase Eha subunit E